MSRTVPAQKITRADLAALLINIPRGKTSTILSVTVGRSQGGLWEVFQAYQEKPVPLDDVVAWFQQTGLLEK